MGEVYKAVDLTLERAVALKVLPEALVRNEDRVARFVREAKAASALNHPHILTIYEVGEGRPAGDQSGAAPAGGGAGESAAPDGAAAVHYIAMEFIDGETLRQKIHGDRTDLRKLLGYLAQVADGLGQAHSRGIVHRDLKPDNVMVTRDGYAKILDFGLAKLVERQTPPAGARSGDALGEADTAVMAQHSLPGMVLGTLGYMSPEQAQGLPVDQRSDIFSFGCILYECATGRKPFAGDSAIRALHRIIYEEPAPVTDYNPQAPAALQRIIRRCLAKDPEQRYQTVKDVSIELRELQDELPAGSGQWLPSAGGSGATSGGVGRTSAARASAARSSGGGEESRAAAPDAGRVGASRRSRALALAALLALAVAAAAAFYFRLAPGGGKGSIDSIAVLPFINAGADPEAEYLSDGITESIINSLSQLPDLAVISRSSVFRYKGREMDPQKIGRELKVEALLMGRVVQRGDQIVISTELVLASGNRQIWGEQYNRKLSDIMATQSEISREISEKLRAQLTGDERRRVTKHYTENVEAYQLYLKGRYHWNKRTEEDVRRSAQYFQEAIAKDPSYALAHAGLADCYIVLPVYSEVPYAESYPKAQAAAARALELDETLAEAHTSMGALKTDYEWKFAEGEAELKRAIELNPNYATARHWYAQFLSARGRHEEAFVQIRKAQALDPLSLIISTVVGHTHLKARQYDQAIAQLRKTLEMDKNFVQAHLILGEAYQEKGMFAEAAAEYQAADVLGGRSPEEAAKKAAALREAFASGGARGYWLRRLELLREEMGRGKVSPYEVASLYARVGDREGAVEWLRKAYAGRDPYIFYLKVAPQFDSLRADPRVVDLMREIGLDG